MNVKKTSIPTPAALQGKQRVVLYARVSKSDQHADNQLHKLREYVKSQPGWVTIREYTDHASGSSADNRPELRALLYDASQGIFDLVVFWSLDRLTREGAQKTLEYLATFDRYGVRYRSLVEPFLDTTGPFKDLLISIMGALGQQERNRLRERVSAGMSRAKKNGVRIGRPRKVIDGSKLAELSKTHSLAQIAAITGTSRATASRRIKAYREKNE